MEPLGSTLVEALKWLRDAHTFLSMPLPAQRLCPCPQSAESSQPISKGEAMYFSLEFAHVGCSGLFFFITGHFDKG